MKMKKKLIPPSGIVSMIRKYLELTVHCKVGSEFGAHLPHPFSFEKLIFSIFLHVVSLSLLFFAVYEGSMIGHPVVFPPVNLTDFCSS